MSAPAQRTPSSEGINTYSFAPFAVFAQIIRGEQRAYRSCLTQKKFSVVGQRVQRVEGFEKVTGDSKFIADVFLPGMLVGKVLRSPFPHARVRHIDISKAEKLAGVRAVVTAEDTIKRPWGAFFADQYILSVGKARYVGEEVAAVAAIDPDIAEEAVDLIEVDWEPLPGVFDAEEAMQDGAPLVHDDKPNNIAMTMDIERGNVAQAFAESDVIVEDTFQSMPQWHCSIETIGSVAEYAPGGKYTIYMNTQTLFNALPDRRRVGRAGNRRAHHSKRRGRLRRQILRRQ
jgi:CO/xanthine dehydrogenase Mo-binding subunit